MSRLLHSELFAVLSFSAHPEAGYTTTPPKPPPPKRPAPPLTASTAATTAPPTSTAAASKPAAKPASAPAAPAPSPSPATPAAPAPVTPDVTKVRSVSNEMLKLLDEELKKVLFCFVELNTRILFSLSLSWVFLFYLYQCVHISEVVHRYLVLAGRGVTSSCGDTATRYALFLLHERRKTNIFFFIFSLCCVRMMEMTIVLFS